MASEDSKDQNGNAVRVYSFSSLDQVSEAAKACGDLYNGTNTLYKKPGTFQYYLVMTREDGDDLGFSRACNILSEYGTKIRHEYASEAYYEEHYETVCRGRALQVMREL